MDEKLLKALEIQAEDIDANRNGQFSPRQVRKLQSRNRARMIPLAAFVMLLFMMMLFTLQGVLGQMSATGEAQYGRFAWAMIAILGVMSVTVVRQIWVEWAKASRAIQQAELKAIRGPVKLLVERDSNNDPWHYVRIGSQKFKVIPPVYEAFEPKQKYALYYTSTTNQIVGAERLDTP